VIACDPGLANVGYGVVRRHSNSARPELVESGKIETPADWGLNDRLKKIWRELALLCCDKQIRPHYFGIEDQNGARVGARMNAKRQLDAARQGKAIKAFGFNANTDAVGEVVGIMKAVAFSYGIPVVMYAPQQAKIAVCGKGMGHATKLEVINAIRFVMFQGINQTVGEHEADALAGAVFVERMVHMQNKVVRGPRAAMQKARKAG